MIRLGRAKCAASRWIGALLMLIVSAAGLLRPGMVRASAPGSLDPTFGEQGQSVVSFGLRAQANDVQLLPDGKILVVGATGPQSGTGFAMARYLPNGVPDPTFGSGGWILGDPELDGFVAQRAAPVSGGKFLIVGLSRMNRYLANGTLDPTFGTAGRVDLDQFRPYGTPFSLGLTLQSDGKILVAGSADGPLPTEDDFLVARFLPNGAPDPTFGNSGSIQFDFNQSGDGASLIRILGDGKILVAGNSHSRFAVARLLTTGVLDTTFGGGSGRLVTDFGGNFAEAYGMTVQNDGKFLICGVAGAGTGLVVARYNPNGNLDATFGNGTGKFISSIGARLGDYGRSVAVQTDGRILVSGWEFDGFEGRRKNFLATRLLANGSIDPSYGIDGRVYIDFFGSEDEATSAVLQPDGKLIIAGSTETPPFGASFALARLLPGNRPPTANEDRLTTPEDTPLLLTGSNNPLGNDVELDGEPLTLVVGEAPEHGTLGSAGGGSLRYTPDPDYSGPDRFTYTASDGAEVSETAVVYLTITPANDPPVAQNDVQFLLEDTTLTLPAPGILGNDYDEEGTALTALRVAGPSHGLLTLNSDGGFTYQPTADYSGTDQFTYRASDGSAQSNLATVTLNVQAVNAPPGTLGQAVSTPEDTARAITLSGNRPVSAPFTYVIVTDPVHGTLSGAGADRVYMPAPDYFGSDLFRFTITDGNQSGNIATVSITVSPAADAPVAANGALQTAEDVAVSLTLTAADADGDPLTYVVTAPPLHGALSGTGANRNYTPAPNYAGSDSLQFKVGDGTLFSGTATVVITVTPRDDAPAALNGAVETAEGTAAPLALTASDPDGDPLTFAIVSPPFYGELSGSGAARTYVPDPGFTGIDYLMFSVTDGRSTSTALVVILVTSQNEPPTAVAGPDQIVEATGPSTPVSLNGSRTSDPDGDSMTFVWREGSTVLANSQNATISLPLGVHHLRLTVTDSSGATGTDDVDVTVRDTTPPVITVPANFTVPQTTPTGTTVTYQVTATDLVSTATVQSSPASGSAFPLGATTVQCTAVDAAGNSAARSFVVTVSDPGRTPSGKFTAKGTFLSGGVTYRITVSANQVSARPLKGSLSVTNTTTRQVIKSVGVSALQLEGTTARLFGVAKVGTGTLQFVAVAQDLGASPAADRFQFLLADGTNIGPAPFKSGGVTIKNQTARRPGK